ncbi:hypothetical protein O0L34_g18749 [Tuta absoluta]|nr:hypothetical protein O0L34_g18749 [Tuta absoluta]
MQVTMSRNAKTLSPSHVKQCILAESRFDFLRDLVKNIPDVSAAEEKEMQMSAESSPNSSRFSDASAPRRIVREDSNSSSSCDVRVQQLPREPLPREQPPSLPRETLKRNVLEEETKVKIETVTSPDAAIDLSMPSQVRVANFYTETLIDPVQQRSVITVNPTYSCPQPSTSSYAPMTPVEPTAKPDTPKSLIKPLFFVDVSRNAVVNSMTPPRTPVTPILNIDFTKNIANPEIKVLEPSVANIVVKENKERKQHCKLQRQNSKVKSEPRREPKPSPPVNIDHINSGNLQIDEDYDT